MPSERPILELKDVIRRFELPESGRSVEVLRGVSLELKKGESAAIMGPSGSGKSTLLHIMGGLDRPSGGQVLIDGVDLAVLKDGDLAEVRSRQAGFVFQAHYLLPQCTVLENVLIPTLAVRTRGGSGEEAETAERRATRLLERAGLGGRLDHRPGQLSGGERQRVAVARALINRPRLLLADEPTGALDHATAGQLVELLAELNCEEGVTLVIVTHAPEVGRRMGRVFELRDGRLAGGHG